MTQVYNLNHYLCCIRGHDFPQAIAASAKKGSDFVRTRNLNTFVRTIYLCQNVVIFADPPGGQLLVLASTQSNPSICSYFSLGMAETEPLICCPSCICPKHIFFTISTSLLKALTNDPLFPRTLEIRSSRCNLD